MFTYNDLHTAAAARLRALPVMPCIAMFGRAAVDTSVVKTVAPTNDAQGSPPRGEPC